MTDLSFDGYAPTWCPGCGDWGIRIGIKNALLGMGLNPSKIAVVFDIGCSGNMNDFLNAYAMHGLHGRAIATAVGVKIANHDMTTVVIGGDGGLYGEGGNHFLHACRGNHDITVIVHDNSVYGLTKGQSAPTAETGYKSSSTPQGIIEQSVNPLSLAITQGATFVAQGFAGDTIHLAGLIKAGVEHKGFSLINILQPCVTFNKVNTYQYYLKRVYKLDEKYNPEDFSAAMQKSIEINEEKYPLGVIYKTSRPVFHEQWSTLQQSTLLKAPRYTDFDSLVGAFI